MSQVPDAYIHVRQQAKVNQLLEVMWPIYESVYDINIASDDVRRQASIWNNDDLSLNGL